MGNKNFPYKERVERNIWLCFEIRLKVSTLLVKGVALLCLQPLFLDKVWMYTNLVTTV